MINPNQFEQQALQAAGQHGGAYIESIGKTDLGQFSAQEWATLVEVIVTAFQDSLRAACADDVPF